MISQLCWHPRTSPKTQKQDILNEIKVYKKDKRPKKKKKPKGPIQVMNMATNENKLG